MGQRADFVRPEARPVIFTGDNHRNLLIAKGFNMVQRLLILGEVDHLITNPLFIECAIGGVALDTVRFTVNNNAHDSHLPFRLKERRTGQITEH